MSGQDKPTEDSADSKALPELRLKAGFQGTKPSASSHQEAAPERTSQALTIDDMLAITKGRPSQPVQEESISQDVPVRPVAPPPAPPVSPPATPASPPAPPSPPPPPAFPAESTPLTLNSPPPAFAQPGPKLGGGFSANTPLGGTPGRFQFLQEFYETRPRVVQGVGALLVVGLVTLAVVGLLGMLQHPVKLRIESQPNAAEVFLGDELLGQTPLKIELTDLDEMPVLKLAGYETTEVPRPETIKPDKWNIVSAKLQGVSFPLDWSGLDEKTQIWWDGAETRPKSTATGTYKIKVKPPQQSSFVWSAKVPWKQGQAYPIGQAVAKEIAKRPVLKLSLSGVSQATVIVKDGPRFTHTLKLQKTASAVTLPGPGSYAVKVKSNAQHGSFEKTVEVQSGEKKGVQVALYRPRTQHRRVTNSRPIYSPRRSNPAPAYRPSGRSAGGIAPPAF